MPGSRLGSAWDTDAVVRRLIPDPGTFQSAFGVLMPIQAELGIAGKLGTELQEQGPKFSSAE